MSLFDPPGGVAFSYLVIIKSMTHTDSPYEIRFSEVEKDKKFV